MINIKKYFKIIADLISEKYHKIIDITFFKKYFKIVGEISFEKYSKIIRSAFFKKYYKAFGAFLFVAVVAYGGSTLATKNIQNNKNLSKPQTETASAAKDEAIAASIDNKKSDSQSEPKKIEIIEYTVKTSDTIESIAAAYEIKPSTIASSNGIDANAVLTEGQKLSFPSIDGILYTIKGGETIWDLSNLYKLTSEQIIAVNKLEDPDKLKLGQKLIMPDAEKILSLNINTAPTKASETAKPSTKSKNQVALNRGARPARGSFTSGFGKRWGKLHKGVDIGASYGSNVSAFLDGKVIFSGKDNGGYGNLVIISHGNGIETYYGHNSKLLVKVGQTVSKGTVIAKVGSTGHSTGPHLHFEVRKNGTPINPAPYLK